MKKFKFTIRGNNYEVEVVNIEDNIAEVEVNGTKYEVEINNAKEPFNLILTELFNSGWKLKFEDEQINQQHFLIDSFANGWTINKKGDYQLIIYFDQEERLQLGKIVSWISLSTSLLIVVILIQKLDSII